MAFALLDGFLNLSLVCVKPNLKKVLTHSAVQRFSVQAASTRQCQPTKSKLLDSSSANVGFPGNSSFLSANLHISAQSYLRTKLPWDYVRAPKAHPEFNTGDYAGLADNVDLSKSTHQFIGCKELEDADESVKKIFSLQFASVYTRHMNIKWMNIKKIQKHVLDMGSLESQITAITFGIRHWQVHMKKRPRDVKKKKVLMDLIGRRQKYLRILRERDIYRFEWILKELSLTFTPYIPINPPVTKKGWLRDMTHRFCEGLRKTKIEAYRDQLKSEQAQFLKEKEEKLKFIEEESKALGLTDEELATVRYVDTGVSKPGPLPVAASLKRIALTTEGMLDSPILPHREELPQ